MSIVNEDPAMCKFLLNKDADLHQRACGAFFTPDDQKIERRDVITQEQYSMPISTNYEGLDYCDVIQSVQINANLIIYFNHTYLFNS